MLALVIGARGPCFAQSEGGEGIAETLTNRHNGGSFGSLTPLGLYVTGSVFCAAAAPIVGTILLNREMTANEVYRSALGCFLGPAGWLLANQLFPPGVIGASRSGGTGGPREPTQLRQATGGNISIPRQGDTNFVPNEVLLQFVASASAQQIAQMASQLQLALLETQTFGLTGLTLSRYRIDGGQSVRALLLALRRFGIVGAAQPNHYFFGQQIQAPAPQTDTTQYVVSKLNLVQAHRITSGDDVLVAVIDSQIDMNHPDLTGAFADHNDLLGLPATPHAHGTAMAGAIAAHSKLIGVAPKVRLLAVRAFSGTQDSAQGTTFNILKALDWAASKNARIVNMSFAGPADRMLRAMLAKAYARGIVLIAAVGNAGPRSPPLFPASDRYVIGVTATDADDKLLPLANRGRQVTVAAPGVEILADAPDGIYQLTSGTSVAAAHVSGVAALLLASDPKLTPAGFRRALVRSARKIPGSRRDVGAGVIDALAALRAIARTQ
jgi:subtilisin family serine protease